MLRIARYLVLMAVATPQAGAKHVYGIERSAIADQATLIVKDNGYSDRVTIIKGTRKLWSIPSSVLMQLLAQPFAPPAAEDDAATIRHVTCFKVTKNRI